ncbi:MAG: hypothetical protein H6707_00930 [Deltaproteobacteria bacterium]|nr:hypothetical protein [Deltaproteobacteria bacterium]
MRVLLLASLLPFATCMTLEPESTNASTGKGETSIEMVDSNGGTYTLRGIGVGFADCVPSISIERAGYVSDASIWSCRPTGKSARSLPDGLTRVNVAPRGYEPAALEPLDYAGQTWWSWFGVKPDPAYRTKWRGIRGVTPEGEPTVVIVQAYFSGRTPKAAEIDSGDSSGVVWLGASTKLSRSFGMVATADRETSETFPAVYQAPTLQKLNVNPGAGAAAIAELVAATRIFPGFYGAALYGSQPITWGDAFQSQAHTAWEKTTAALKGISLSDTTAVDTSLAAMSREWEKIWESVLGLDESGLMTKTYYTSWAHGDPNKQRPGAHCAEGAKLIATVPARESAFLASALYFRSAAGAFYLGCKTAQSWAPTSKAVCSAGLGWCGALGAIAEVRSAGSNPALFGRMIAACHEGRSLCDDNFTSSGN